MTVAHADAVDGVLRTVRLSGDRTLIVRNVTAADVDGLDALFAGLCDDDRYSRFFSMFHPPREFLEQMTRVAEEGGFRLVAIVRGAEDKLVAEAAYVLLPDGNGEFALTVAEGWRGWLGPYLLHALVAAAAARGVPNLLADILVVNARMLALVSSRGYVTVEHEASELRVAIGAAQPAKRRQDR